MIDRSLDSTLAYLRRVVAPAELEQVADAVLVERFGTSGDADAFATLLRRHGPRVFAVCRRMLGHVHDADEAFQATFLVLAARPQSLRRRESLAAWLHGVAVRVALRLAAIRQRHAARHEGVEWNECPARQPNDASELREILDRELAALPEQFRATLLLCDLEGVALEDAARQLGCTAGAVRARLWRGRKLLQQRLARRGVFASVPLLDLARPQPALELERQTLRTALLFAAGATEPDATTQLAQGVLQAMRPTHLKRTIGICLLAFVLLGPVLLRAMPDAPPEPPEAACVPAPPPRPLLVTEVAAEVLAVAVSPDGKRLATGCADKTVRLWDGAGRKEVGSVKDLPGPVKVVQFAADNKTLTLVCAVEKGVEVRWWDVATGKASSEPLAVACGTTALALSADGKTLASADGGINVEKQEHHASSVALHDLAPGAKTTVLGKVKYCIAALAFSPDGRYLGGAGPSLPGKGASWPAHATIWDVQAGKEWGDLQMSAIDARSVAFSPDSKVLAVGDLGETHLWDMAVKDHVVNLPHPPRQVTAVAYSRDGGTLFTGDTNGVVRRWDLKTKMCAARLWRAGGRVNCLTAAPDGATVVAGGANGSEGALRRWNPEKHGEKEYFLESKFEVYGLAVGTDGRTLLASADKQFLRWDLTEVRTATGLQGFKDRARAAVFSPDGKTIAAGGEEANTLRLFDADTGKERAVFSTGGTGTFRELAYSPDGKTVAAAGNLYDRTRGNGGHIVLWDVKTGKARTPFPQAAKAYLGVAISPDGKLVAGASWDGHVRVYDLATEKERLDIAAHACVFAVRFTPDGKHLISAGTNGEVTMWALASGKAVANFKGQHGNVYALALNRNGDRVAAGSEDGVVRVWDVKTATETWSHRAHSSGATVLFSPDGTTLFSGGWDGLVRLWDARSGKELLEPR